MVILTKIVIFKPGAQRIKKMIEKFCLILFVIFLLACLLYGFVLVSPTITDITNSIPEIDANTIQIIKDITR